MAGNPMESPMRHKDWPRRASMCREAPGGADGMGAGGVSWPERSLVFFIVQGHQGQKYLVGGFKHGAFICQIFWDMLIYL